MKGRALLSAAVVGLGQAGSRFDEEPRPAVWSHVGAYLAAAERYRLAGGADIDQGNRERFAARCPGAEVFTDPRDMVSHLKPDVVSVCTPPAGRAGLVEGLLEAHRPRVLICEKPLERDGARRRHLVAACARAAVPLLVNYNRRYDSLYREARRAIVEDRLGTVTAITVIAPNRLWSMGSHAVDLLLYLAGAAPERWRVLPLPALDESGEPAADLICRFPGGAAGRVLSAGYRDMLVFDLDIIGRRGRLTIRQGEGAVVFTPFEDSASYVGYRVPGAARVLHRAPETESPFEALVREAACVAEGTGEAASTGDSALASETLLEAMVAECMTERAA